MAIGFEFPCKLSGTYTLSGHPESERRCHLAIKIDHPLRDFWQGLGEISGRLDMEDFADEVPVSGTSERSLLGRQAIRLDLAFLSSEGQRCRLVGDVKLGARSLVLAAEIRGVSDSELGRARLEMDPRAELLPAILGFRVTH